MPTGLNNSPESTTGQGNSKFKLPQPAINVSFGLTFDASGILNLPGYLVPPQATVRVRARAGNEKVINTALSRDGLFAANADVITPDTEIIYPVANLAQIWAKGQAGDSLNVSIRANPTS
jgi:hypothetical protein